MSKLGQVQIFASIATKKGYLRKIHRAVSKYT